MRKNWFPLFSILAILITSSLSGFSQKPKEVETREVYVNFPDSVVRINILVKNRNVKILNDRIYFWYKSDQLYSNRAGYAGNLLHGQYVQFDRKKRLRVEGSFKYGLKDGTWKNWNENGELLSIVIWKKGFKDGLASFYDKNGNLQMTGHFKDDKLNGVVTRHNSKSKENIRYKDGYEIRPKPKEEKKHADRKSKNNTANIPSTDNIKADSTKRVGLPGIFHFRKNKIKADTALNEKKPITEPKKKQKDESKLKNEGTNKNSDRNVQKAQSINATTNEQRKKAN